MELVKSSFISSARVETSSALESHELDQNQAADLCEGCRRLDLARMITSVLLSDTAAGQRVSSDYVNAYSLAEFDMDIGIKHNPCSLCRFLLRVCGSRYTVQEGDLTTLCLILINKIANQPWYHTFSLLPKNEVKAIHIPSFAVEFPKDVSRVWPSFARPLMPKAGMGLLHDWIQHCSTSHNSCKRNYAPDQEGSFSILLLECRSRKIVSGSLDSNYATLSYVW
jgi:hypothetical protein